MLLHSTSVASCANAQFNDWVARFGVSQQITSDRVSQFCSSVWVPFTQWLGIKMRLTTPYHPQSNGAVKQFHRHLQGALRARLPRPDWVKHLPWVMLSLRATTKEDSGVSTAELVCSAPLSLPGQVLSITEPPPTFFMQQLWSSLRCVADWSGSSPAASSPSPALQSAAFIYLQTPPLSSSLSLAYCCPYPMWVPDNKYFVIEIGSKLHIVLVDNIKPHLGSTPISAAPALRHRCPPKQVSR
jgi:hypothetical protein